MLLGLAAGMAGARAAVPSYEWQLVAGPAIGSGVGNADGTGPAARFNQLSGVVVDGSGNTYVADTNNSTIRKITSAGVVTTLAGLPGQSGAQDGMGRGARFNQPTGLALDGSGNIYVADTFNSEIRVVHQDGSVLTLTGSGGVPYKFFRPNGVALDAAGNIYVADTGDELVQKISNQVETIVSGTLNVSGTMDGVGGGARFNKPYGIVVDGSANIWVSDEGSSQIRKITGNTVVTVTGSDVTTGTTAMYSSPQGLAVDTAGNIYIADRGDNKVRKLGTNGQVTLAAGSPIYSPNGLTNQPEGVALDGSGNLYVTIPNAVVKVSGTTYSGLAGPWRAGSPDGIAGAAMFNGPNAVALDGSGNIYVADKGANLIRKVTSDGVVTTVAGNLYSSGTADGTGAAAQFNGPAGIALDGSGNIYVADTGNDTIRKITPDGTVSTFAGSPGQPGNSGGQGSAARFSGPMGLAVDTSGNVYVADSGNNSIRVITSGTVSTLAGYANFNLPGYQDGPAADAEFSGPEGVAVDAKGNVYVADTGNLAVRVISGGTVSTLAGNPNLPPGNVDATGTSATFTNPGSVSVDGNRNVYVGDYGSETIREITSAGLVTTLAGNRTTPVIGDEDGVGVAASFSSPMGVAADAQGNVYVADAGNNAIRKVTTVGVVTTVAGAPSLQSPTGMAMDKAGNGYFADGDLIYKVTSTGEVSALAGNPNAVPGTVMNGPGAQATFFMPEGLAADANGNVYVADSGNQLIRKITSGGTVSTYAGVAATSGTNDGNALSAKFNNPSAVAVDGSGNVYVADSLNNTIRVITSGTVSTLAGDPNTTPGSNDGPAGQATFDEPSGVAVDGSGNVYVADTQNDTIRMITSGTVSTLAGSAGSAGSTDGLTGTDGGALFNAPNALAVDGSGNVYVSDEGNETIRLISTSGTVSTIGGTPGVLGGQYGVGPAAQFSQPSGIAVSSDGNTVLVTDGGNERVSLGANIYGPPQLATLKILSSNGNNQAAKVGDTVYVTFDSYLPIQTGTVTILGRSATVVNTNGNEWTASTMVKSGDPLGPVQFTVNYASAGGTPGTPVSATTDNSKVVISTAVPSVSGVTIASNGANPVYAKAGDVITLSFASTEALQTPKEILIAGRPADNVVNVSGNNWQATITVTGSDAQGPTSFSLAYKSISGVAGTAVSTTSDGSSVTIDTVAPVLNPVSIASSGNNAHWAKAGDVLTLSFTANKTILTPSVQIAGRGAAVQNPSGDVWVGSVTVTGSDTQGLVPFLVNFQSLSGVVGMTGTVPGVRTTTDSSSVIIDTIAPTIDASSVPTGGYHSGEELPELTGLVKVSDTNGAQVTQQPPAGYILKSGTVPVTFTATDPAGNSNQAQVTLTVPLPRSELLNGTVPGTVASTFSAFGTPQTGAFGGKVKTGAGRAQEAVFGLNGSLLLTAGTGYTALGQPSGDAVLATLKGGGTALLTGLSSGNPVVMARTARAGLAGVRRFLAIDGNGTDTFFLATLQGPGVTAANNVALEAVVSGTPSIVAQTGDVVPLGSGVKKSIKTLTTLQSSAGTAADGRWRADDTDMGFRATFTDGSLAAFIVSATEANPVNPVSWKIVGATGFVSGVPKLKGAVGTGLGLPSFYPGGAAFLETLSTNFAGIEAGQNVALLSGSNELAQKGLAAADANGAAMAGVVYGNLYDPVSGRNGEVAFEGTTVGGGVHTGIWYAADGATPKLIALTGSAAPGGGRFARFTSMVLPPYVTGSDGPVFAATLVVSAADGVNGRNNSGLWGLDSTGTLRLLLRTDQSLSVNGVTKTVRSFTALAPAVGSPGAASGYDRNGVLAVLVVFTDRTQALVTQGVP